MKLFVIPAILPMALVVMFLITHDTKKAADKAALEATEVKEMCEKAPVLWFPWSQPKPELARCYKDRKKIY